MSALLMFERVMRGADPNTDAADAQILADARATVREILEDAELTLWALEDAGWVAPDDDDAITYAARLLLTAGRLGELLRAVRLAQEITFGRKDGS